MSADKAYPGHYPKREPHLKGGGSRGGPRRWTGTGPRPARHVPWPELFKHHESNLTGHLKMMDMVRKHCVEGTGNWQTAMACIDRTRKMLNDFRLVKRNFAPPRDSINQVPLGASSASVYPGYSPADHIYGEAAQEYGQLAADVRKQGIDFKLDQQGPEYVVGQTSKAKKEQLAKVSDQIRSARKQQDNPADHAQELDSAAEGDHTEAGTEPMEGVEETRPMFFIDSNPTAVIMNDTTRDQSYGKLKNQEKQKKRRKSHEADKAEHVNTTGGAISAKKAKTSSETALAITDEDSTEKQENKDKELKRAATEEGDGYDKEITSQFEHLSKKTKTADEPVIEEDDIEAEVESRLKAKAEKRRLKEEKKRKRESGDALTVTLQPSKDPSTESKHQPLVVDVEKPKRKKVKMEGTTTESNEDKVVRAESNVKVGKVEKTKMKEKKKRKSEGGNGEEAKANGSLEAGAIASEKNKKRKTKMKADD